MKVIVNISNTRCIIISEAVTVPSLHDVIYMTMMISTLSEESLARGTQTQMQTDSQTQVVYVKSGKVAYDFKNNKSNQQETDNNKQTNKQTNQPTNQPTNQNNQEKKHLFFQIVPSWGVGTALSPSHGHRLREWRQHSPQVEGNNKRRKQKRRQRDRTPRFVSRRFLLQGATSCPSCRSLALGLTPALAPALAAAWAHNESSPLLTRRSCCCCRGRLRWNCWKLQVVVLSAMYSR